ncbi:MAG: DUF1553 domain-containing protein [Planctomycetales bacterium]|nr:DUF1553 domain-containing protein [Planctomycetales bacterium]
MRRTLYLFGLIAIPWLGACHAWSADHPFENVAAPSPVADFNIEVMSALAKGGCNAGRCHGNSNGRGGFFLSLRGQFPHDDFLSLTEDMRSRRIDRAHPAQSLLLLKATAQVPHEGGQRFAATSPEYQILAEWIRRGAPPSNSDTQVSRIRVTPGETLLHAPNTSLQLNVLADFSDGTQRDVTRLAIYEPADLRCEVDRDGLVRCQQFGESTIVVRYLNCQSAVQVTYLPEETTFAWHSNEPANRIDDFVYKKLRQLRINPAKRASDTEFLRRVSLDLTGSLPTAMEAREFANDPSPDKRARAIDRLLQHPDFANHWALKWADLLRVEEKTMDATGVEVFHGWIRDYISRDGSFAELAQQILAASGSTYQNPPANFYRAIRQPDELAEAVAQVFLGTRLRCAKCHDHPFEQWTQDDYYGLAALFAPIHYEIIKNDRRDKFDKNQFIGEQIVKRDGDSQVRHPRDRRVMAPKYLMERESLDARGQSPAAQLDDFASWLASPEHPLFARVLVNRLWSEMLGVGIVEPVDDFRLTNPPSHPELLDWLTSEFVRNDFQLRPMLRVIAQSNTYQTSWQMQAEDGISTAGAEWDAEFNRTFAVNQIRRLTAEQLVDAISQVTQVPTDFDGYPPGIRAVEIPGVNREYRRHPAKRGNRFLQLFGKPERLLTCACERSNETTLNQVFELTTGKVVREQIGDDAGRLATLLVQHESNASVLDELYWVTLSRPPTIDEREQLLTLVASSENRREIFEDIQWALINSKEFLLRR